MIIAGFLGMLAATLGFGAFVVVRTSVWMDRVGQAAVLNHELVEQAARDAAINDAADSATDSLS